MHPVLRNVLAVVLGLVVGSAVNMGIIMISGSIIPPPNGADITTMEGLKSTMHLFGPEHYIFPFLAHALGTLVGAFVAAKIAATNKIKFALAIGAFFFLGGAINAYMLPAPTWFLILDLAGAYFPMAYLGKKLAK
ncbi:MAG: signal peptide protein [Flavobacteriales bacterium BRH_c54]|nr:MAG: signal peptide protein [Flavobacteriales bacterium BRH_c54]